MFRPLLLLFALVLAAPAHAVLRVDINQGISQPMPIAVPAFATPQPASTPAGTTEALGRQVAQVISNDLKSSGLFRPISPNAFTTQVTFPDVARPRFLNWRTVAAQALVSGFVQANADGTITIGCYLYDVFSEETLHREGFRGPPAAWRRGAHKCADRVYSRLTGESGYFDSQIVYISETGPKTNRIKRLAIMDQDGASHRFLTNGQSLVLTPRFAPNEGRIAYMSYANDRPRVHLYENGRHSVVGEFPGMTFAPRFSPDGRYLLLSLIRGGNTDIYRFDFAARRLTRLTEGPGIDTAPSFSPDGQRIVFESDRGGTQQIYVMNADGSGAQRISFGEGRYATPAWSPRGDLIAFTRIGGGQLRVGVMRPDGGGERILTDSWQDEQPSWSPNGRVITYFRSRQGAGTPELWSVDLTGLNERRIPTPLGGSDPSWGPLRP